MRASEEVGVIIGAILALSLSVSGQTVQSISSTGADVLVQLGDGGDLKWRAGAQGNWSAMQQLLDRVTQLETTLADITAQFPDSVNSVLNRNSSTYTYTSNMDPGYAATNGITNDLTVLVGSFSVNSVLKITVQDEGWCSGYAMDYTIVGRWGIHYTTMDQSALPDWLSDPSQFHPEVFTHGSASDFNAKTFQFFFKPRTTSTYWLWLYIPPWAICGASTDGSAAQTHTAQITASASSERNNDFAPQGSPIFNYFAGNASQIIAVDSQVTVSQEDLPTLVDNQMHRNETTFTYVSNLSPGQAIAQGTSNDLRRFLGEFNVATVLEISVQDTGYCSTFGMKFTIVGMWGVHLTPDGAADRHHPECFTFGTANEGLQDTFQFYFRAVSADTYGLYLYIPAWPTCGSGTIPRTHTTNVIITTTAANGANYNPTSVPIFDYFNGNTSNLTRIPTQISNTMSSSDLTTIINGAINRNQTTYLWNSNMDPSWAVLNQQSNDFRQCLGLFSVNTILTVTVQDEGYCSGTAMEFTVVGRWGTHYTNTSQAPSWLADPSVYHPVVFSYGGAGNLWAANLFQFYFVNGGQPHQYYLYLYMPPFPTCGSTGPAGPGTVPRQHRTVITIDASEARGNDFNPASPPVMNYFEGNSSGLVYMPTRITDPSSSPQIQQSVNSALNRVSNTAQYGSNLSPTYAASIGVANELVQFVGVFPVEAVLSIQLQDSGWCSGFGIDYTLVARWGTHLVTPVYSETYHPEIFTFGSATEWLTTRMEWYFTANGASSYYLWFRIPPWPICGSSAAGNVTRMHTTEYTVQASTMRGVDYNPSSVPVFDYFGANTSAITQMRVQLTAPA